MYENLVYKLCAISDFLSVIFYNMLYMSVLAIIIGLVIMLIEEILDKIISPKFKIAIWGVFLIALILPINSQNTNYNKENYIFNTLKQIQTVSFKSDIDEARAEYENYIKNESTTIEGYNYVKNNLEIAKIKYFIFNMFLPILWALIVIGLAINYIYQNYKMRKMFLNKKEKNLPSEKIKKVIEEAKKEIRINKEINVYVKENINSASIYGILNTSVLVPKEYENKDEKDLKYIFMHEMAHYKGGDLIINTVVSILSILYVLNPICYIFFKRIRQDLELKADQIVLENIAKEDYKKYATILINESVASTDRYKVQILNLVGVYNDLERRIYMINFSKYFFQRTLSIFLVALSIISILSFTFFYGREVDRSYENYSFNLEKLQSYKTMYVGDFEAVKRIVKKLNLSRFLSWIKIEGKSVEVIYTASEKVDENSAAFYNFLNFEQTQKDEIMKQNADAMFYLIDNCENVTLTIKSPIDENVVLEDYKFARE